MKQLIFRRYSKQKYWIKNGKYEEDDILICLTSTDLQGSFWEFGIKQFIFQGNHRAVRIELFGDATQALTYPQVREALIQINKDITTLDKVEIILKINGIKEVIDNKIIE